MKRRSFLILAGAGAFAACPPYKQGRSWKALVVNNGLEGWHPQKGASEDERLRSHLSSLD